MRQEDPNSGKDDLDPYDCSANYAVRFGDSADD